MNEEFKELHTLIGGRVRVGNYTRNDLLLGPFDVVTVEHEDGTLEFSEEAAADLIGALSIQLVENRRRREAAALALRIGE